MTDKFDELVESTYPTSLKLIRRTIYPKEMEFSEEFMNALQKEYSRFKTLKENDEARPIKNLEEKFIKAICFRIKGIEGQS